MRQHSAKCRQAALILVSTHMEAIRALLHLGLLSVKMPQMMSGVLLCLQMEEDFIKANPAWVTELEIMVTTKVKAEIQALSSFGFQYLSQVYLPLKLQEGDWI